MAVMVRVGVMVKNMVTVVMVRVSGTWASRSMVTLSAVGVFLVLRLRSRLVEASVGMVSNRGVSGLGQG